VFALMQLLDIVPSNSAKAAAVAASTQLCLLAYCGLCYAVHAVLAASSSSPAQQAYAG
jgi:hypothetical protein